MKNIIVLLIMAAILFAGCSYRLGDLTIASTKNVNIGDKYVVVAKDVQGKNSKPIIICIPMGHPNFEDAIDDALSKADGDLMTNVVIHYSWYYIPYIYGEYIYKVKGDVWKKESGGMGQLQKDIQNAEKIYEVVDDNGQMKLIERSEL
ncbi:hypothetical protein ISS30_10445 [bacterium]|nr:hypothetical protein [bacterium]